MDKTLQVFSMLQKGFSNSLALMPMLVNLYNEIEKIEKKDLDELKEKHPEVAKIINEIKEIISAS